MLCVRALVRALNDAKNYAQQGCAMQFSGITLITLSIALYSGLYIERSCGSWLLTSCLHPGKYYFTQDSTQQNPSSIDHDHGGHMARFAARDVHFGTTCRVWVFVLVWLHDLN